MKLKYWEIKLQWVTSNFSVLGTFNSTLNRVLDNWGNLTQCAHMTLKLIEYCNKNILSQMLLKSYLIIYIKNYQIFSNIDGFLKLI